MRGRRERQRRTTWKRALQVLVLIAVVAPWAVAAAAANPISTEMERDVPCTPGVDTGCLPTPVECATGRYNGHWDGGAAGRLADCVGLAGHIVHYHGGYLGTDQVHPICGVAIDADLVTTGNWMDPNLCPPAGAPRGFGVAGRAFSPGVQSARGIVASISPVATRVGLGILDRGGNAADAATATVLAMGVARPDMCGLGGAGEFVYRSAGGRAGAVEFEPIAPASVTPQLYSGTGLWQLDVGHRVVGVPGIPAGVEVVLKRYGTISLARATEPAIRLAHDGVPVTPGLAKAWYSGPNPTGLPVSATTIGNLMRLFPPSALAYMRAGALPYPPDNPLARSILRVPDLERSLRMLAAHGAEAFYEDRSYPEGPSVARLILQEMRRAAHSPYPGDAPSPWASADLAGYRALERTPLTGSYHGYRVITEPPPSIGGVDVLETLNLLEGFGLGSSIAHSSADYLHLVAEAQKIAWVDTTYLADPAFHDNPVDTLTSKSYAAARRAEIDLRHAKDYGPGPVPGAAAPSAADLGTAMSHNTTPIEVIDAHGNAASFTCTNGGVFGSLIVAPGTGFVLNDLQDFSPAGTLNEARPGKRPTSTLTPTIVARDGRAVLATGAAGGLFIPAPVALMISDRVDYGMDPAHAIDVARIFSFCIARCPESAPPGAQVEDERIPSGALADLGARGQPISRQGEYSSSPRVQSVGTDLATGLHQGASDPREDRGVQAQAP